MATDYLKNKRRLRGIRCMLLAIAAINAIINIILGIISSFFENPIPMYLHSLIVGVCAYLIPLVIYAKITGITAEAAEKKFYLKRCSISNLGLALALGICWQFVMVVISLPSSLIFGSASDAVPISALGLVAAIFVISVIPSIFEEFLFRGIIDGAMSEFNSSAAIIFSSVMFALLHADICNFIGYIAMGAVLTTIVRRTGSVYSAMLFHFGSNTTALLLGFFNSELYYTPVFTIAMFAAALAGFIILYLIFMSKTKKPEKNELIKRGTLLGQSFINIPILLCFVIIIGAMAVMKYVS